MLVDWERPVVRVFGAWTRRGGVGVRGFFFAMRADHSSGNGDFLAEEIRHGSVLLDDRAARKRSQEGAAVAAGAETGVEDRDDAPVAVAADQPPETLTQLQHGARQRV